MEILFSPKGQNAKWLSPVGFPDEKILQKYIEDNPHSIPLSELKEDANMVIICREFLTSHGGKIDHIGIDEDGEIYIIETKQYSNSDKRHVVSQVLDYGASLSSSTDAFDYFIKNCEDWVLKTKHDSLDNYLQSHFGIDESELKILYQNLNINYIKTKFRFIIVMDKASDEIKTYVSFMNANSNFSIFLSEFQRYEDGNQEIIIPNLFGAENERRKTSIPKSEKDHISKSPSNLQNLYSLLKSNILKFGNDISVNPVKYYVGFIRNGKNFLEVRCRTQDLLLSLRSQETFNDPRGLMIPRHKGRKDWSSINLKDENEIESTLDLIKQAYNAI